MKHIREIQHNGLAWLNVTAQTEKELAVVGKRFGFLPADMQESRPPFQRPKLVERSGYYFIVLHFPVFDRRSRRLSFTEVDFFLSGSYLVSVHANQLPALEAFFTECSKSAAPRAAHFGGTAAQLFFELLSRLLEAIFPSLVHVNEDINRVDKQLFSRLPARAIAEEILRLKTNVVTFRRAMQGHRVVLDRLVMNGDRDLNLPAYHREISALKESVGEIWHMLESQKESINALHETNESILTLRTNEVMKTLTIIAVLTFPLTLLATLFAIGAGGTPLVGLPFGFWVIVILVVLAAGAMLWVFKKKRWL